MDRIKIHRYCNDPEFKENRKAVLDKAGHKCEDCACEPNVLHVHHKDLSKNNHSIENLRALCPSCHSSYHEKDLPKNSGDGKKYNCKRCNHLWRSRIQTKPKGCPKCKSPLWNHEKKNRRRNHE